MGSEMCIRDRASVYTISPEIENAASSDFRPESALDTNPRTYWAYLLVTDAATKTSWNGTTYNGALVGYTITFANAEFINYLAFLPMTKYPIRLVDLQYYDGDTWATVPGFSAPDASVDWTSVYFSRIQARGLRLILHQENYERHKYLLSRSQFNLASLWKQIVDEEVLLGVEEEDLTSAQLLEIETNPRFRAYVSALRRAEKQIGDTGLVREVLSDHENVGRFVESVTRVISGPDQDSQLVLKNVLTRETDAQPEYDDDQLEIDKTEYLFGLRTVHVHDRNYRPIGIFRTPKFALRSNPYEIAIDVEEAHTLATDDSGAFYRTTSVEYEIELSPDRKHNILPTDTTTVQDELLDIDPSTKAATLRFTPSAAPAVRASGKSLVYGTDYTWSGDTITIIKGFSPNYRYTATYTPSGTPTLLDVDSLYNSVALESPEFFDHTDQTGRITLKYYPYIAYEIINDESAWYKVEGESRWQYRVAAGDTTIDGISYGPTSGRATYEPILVYVNGVKAYNITDYVAHQHPAFRDDPDNANVFQYIHMGRDIYLSRPLSMAKIEVSYRWLAQYIRVNATLRAHEFIVNSRTPVISSIRLKTRSGW